MLHPTTTILTPDGFIGLTSLKVSDIVKTYFGTATIKQIESIIKPSLKIQAGPTTVWCSDDQEFLLRSELGYVFSVPETNNELVQYAVSRRCEDMLMSLVKVDSISHWNQETLYKLHLDVDYSVIINDYLIVRT